MKKFYRVLAIVLSLQLSSMLSVLVTVVEAAIIYLDSTPGGDCSGNYSIANRNCSGSDGSSYNTLAEIYSNLSASDTAYLRSGTYANVDGDIFAPPNGTSGTHTKLITYQNEVVTINAGANGSLKFSNVAPAEYIEYDGRGLSGTSINIILDGQNSAPGEGIWVGNSSHHIWLYGIEVKQFPTNGTGAAVLFNTTTSHVTYSRGKISTSGNSYPDNAIYISGNNNLVEYIEITNTSGAGIQLYDDPVTNVDDNIIRYNYIHDTSGAVSFARGGSGQAQGITISRGDRNKVYGNIVANLECAESCGSGGGSWGIGFFGSAADNEAVNNTISGLTGSTPAIHIYSGHTGVVVKNNLIDATTLQIEDLGATSPDISNNHCTGAGTSCATTGNPLFVAPGSGDYKLQTGSPAKDAGATLGAPYNVDYLGVTRPQGAAWDIGAYEFAAGSVATPRQVKAIIVE